MHKIGVCVCVVVVVVVVVVWIVKGSCKSIWSCSMLAFIDFLPILGILLAIINELCSMRNFGKIAYVPKSGKINIIMFVGFKVSCSQICS